MNRGADLAVSHDRRHAAEVTNGTNPAGAARPRIGTARGGGGPFARVPAAAGRQGATLTPAGPGVTSRERPQTRPRSAASRRRPPPRVALAMDRPACRRDPRRRRPRRVAQPGRRHPVEVDTARATVEQPAAGGPGAPMLTASGYVVARRRAVVSAKIQGRLEELRVEEGSRVREGALIARLERGLRGAGGPREGPGRQRRGGRGARAGGHRPGRGRPRRSEAPAATGRDARQGAGRRAGRRRGGVEP